MAPGLAFFECMFYNKIMKRIIFHIDVNSAYLSWSALEKLKNGSDVDLRTIPSIIGGDQNSRHGVVLAKSIPAKKYGISTGEPVASALRKCPALVMESPDHALYDRRSQELMELLHTFSPDIEKVSIDECYLDFTGIAHLYPSPMEAAALIKDTIHDTLGFTVNIGISNCKLLAKMASDFTKPDRIHTLFPEEIRQKMWPLPVSELFMVGRTSAQKLQHFGISTIGDLAQADVKFLTAHFKSHGQLMWEYANGIDESPVISQHQEVKGIGNSTTLREDVTDEIQAQKVLLALCESVSGRLRRSHQLAQTVAVEIKYSDFSKASHQMQPLSACNTTNAIYEISCALFSKLWDGRPIRLLGVRTSRLLPEDAPTQISLFDYTPEAKKEEGHSGPSSEKLQKLDAAMDQIRQRYGKDSVIRGTFLHHPADSGHKSASDPSATAHHPERSPSDSEG